MAKKTEAKEKHLYAEALAGKQYCDIIVGSLGVNNATKAICAYFPVGKRIVFMDDDQERFYEFDASGNLTKQSTNLKQYLDDGFATIDKYNCGAFSFSMMTNKFWLKGKPFKELRPAFLPGNLFGARNDPELITTDYSHCDDVICSVNFINKYGGVLVYWWAGTITKYNVNPGGINASGDRTAHHKITQDIYNNEELIHTYCNPPETVNKTDVMVLKLKRLPTLKAILKGRGITPLDTEWDKWFVDEPKGGV
jgi:hypothetical protein